MVHNSFPSLRGVPGGVEADITSHLLEGFVVCVCECLCLSVCPCLCGRGEGGDNFVCEGERGLFCVGKTSNWQMTKGKDKRTACVSRTVHALCETAICNSESRDLLDCKITTNTSQEVSLTHPLALPTSIKINTRRVLCLTIQDLQSTCTCTTLAHILLLSPSLLAGTYI